MDDQQFSNLYVNANCLAELALMSAEQELEQELADATGQEPATAATEGVDFDAALAASFEGLDLSVLDDLNLGQASPDDPPDEAIAPANAAVSESPATDETFHINRYMANAYDYQTQLATRITAASQRADHDELRRLLRQLPGRLTPLTERLSGSQAESWLDVYRSNLAPLDELIIAIRRLDV